MEKALGPSNVIAAENHSKSDTQKTIGRLVQSNNNNNNKACVM